MQGIGVQAALNHEGEHEHEGAETDAEGKDHREPFHVDGSLTNEGGSSGPWPSRCDADLMRAHGLSHTEFLALMFLSEAPDRTLRISDLAAVCQQSLSAISRTVGRLENAGLVRREQAPHDARSYNAVLTDQGLARLDEAWPTHLDSVRRYFLSNLQGIDLRAPADSLQRMAAQQ